jgi:hypothetical protein
MDLITTIQCFRIVSWSKNVFVIKTLINYSRTRLWRHRRGRINCVVTNECLSKRGIWWKWRKNILGQIEDCRHVTYMFALWSILNLNYSQNLEVLKLLLCNCKFLYRLTLKKKYINLHFKFGKNKFVMRIERLIDTLSLRCWLNHLNSASSKSLRLGFGNRFILDLFISNALKILADFKNPLNRRIYETKFPTHVSFFFLPFYISLITSSFSSILTIFCWWLYTCYHSTSLLLTAGIVK